MSNTFEPTMRLAFQGSIPVHTDQQAKDIYNELRVFIKSWSENCTLNGQVIMMLEPCCKNRKEQNKDEQISHMA